MAAFTPFSSPLSPSVPPVSSGNKRSTSCRKKFPTVVEKRREGPREGDRQTGDAARAVAAAEARKVESHRTELKPIMWAGFRSAVAGRGSGSRSVDAAAESANSTTRWTTKFALLSLVSWRHHGRGQRGEENNSANGTARPLIHPLLWHGRVRGAARRTRDRNTIIKCKSCTMSRRARADEHDRDRSFGKRATSFAGGKEKARRWRWKGRTDGLEYVVL